ncbi:hypothetical protein FRC03_008792 [Tulasnella sp. 419]|nr:hypothetical protein FRC03_008792 [Tulasnella sp. 419]
MMAGTGVLLLRIWVLYNRNRKLIAVLIAVYGLTFTPLMVIVIKKYLTGGLIFTYATALGGSTIPLPEMDTDSTVMDTIPYEMVSELDSLFSGCYVSGYPRGFAGIYLAALLYETLLFCLTIYKLWKLRFSSGLVVALSRDGIFYYVVIMASLLCATVLAQSKGLARSVIASSFFIACKSMTISHLILRLRGYLTSDPESAMSQSPRINETMHMRFAPPIVSGSAGDNRDDAGMGPTTPRRKFRELKIDAAGFWVPRDEFELRERRHSRSFSRPHPEARPSTPAITLDSGRDSWFSIRQRWLDDTELEANEINEGEIT